MEPLSFTLGILGMIVALLAIGWYIGEAMPLQGVAKKFGELKEWTDKHSFLKLLFAVFSLYLLFYVPTVMLKEDTQTCDFLLVNTSLQGNNTLYNYGYTCADTGNTTGLSVFKLYGRLLWLVALYGLIVGILIALKKVTDWGRS